MKRAWGLLLFLAALLLCSAAMADVEISEAVFPDEGFRGYILDAGFDGNGDGRLSRAEIRKVTTVDCHSRNIKSLQGIETFTELVELQCYDNQLTEVDVSKNKKLASLGAYRNRLTRLDLSKCGRLVSFSCSGNPVSELLLPNTRKLTWVDLTWTELRELEIGKYPILVKLVKAGEPTRYIYGESEEQVNWVTETSFLAVDRQFTLKAKGAVIYDGAAGAEAAAENAEAAETAEAPADGAGKKDKAEAAAENAEAAETAEAPADGAGKKDKAEAAAETGGKQRFARIVKPDFNGGFNTLWVKVPENFTMILSSDEESRHNFTGELKGYMDAVTLKCGRKKDTLYVDLRIIASGRWMEYANLNEVPEDVLKEMETYYIGQYSNEPLEIDVYEFQNGLKVFRQLNSVAAAQGKCFVGWTVHNGYEVTVECCIVPRGNQWPPYPGEQDLQYAGMVLESLEEIGE